ncbi:MAG: hypothetical protein HYY13_08265 [Nitrospirae bacterium]|nr:hypothetical protein [Nitrospirota bacterium]
MADFSGSAHWFGLGVVDGERSSSAGNASPERTKPFSKRGRRGGSGWFRRHLGALGSVVIAGLVLATSISYRPREAASVPKPNVPYTSSSLNKSALVADLKRSALDYLEPIIAGEFDKRDVRDLFELITCGTTDYQNCVCLDNTFGCTKAEDTDGDGHFLFYDNDAADPLGRMSSCGGGPECEPEVTLLAYEDNAHNTSHPNEDHFDMMVRMEDFYMEMNNSIIGDCISLGLNHVDFWIMMDPDKIDVNGENARTDDPVMTIQIANVDVVAPSQNIHLGCSFGFCLFGNCIPPLVCDTSHNGCDQVPWSCVEPIAEPILADVLIYLIHDMVRGSLPMDLNALIAGEPPYNCPTYSGTTKDAANWCQCGVQNDPGKDGYGYCKDCDGDGLPNTVLPAYTVNPPTAYGSVSKGSAIIDVGAYPHLTVTNPDGAEGPDDRIQLQSDFACETRQAGGDVDKDRINVQPKLCSGNCAPTPPANPDYDNNGTPEDPMFSCSVGQDAMGGIAGAITRSGGIACEVSDQGVATNFRSPVPLPSILSDALKVESFAKLVPPIDDYADPGSSVTIRWRPYGDGDPSTTEVCMAVGAEPGPALVSQGCSALVNTGPVDVNFSLRNIYTDFYIEKDATLTRAFGIVSHFGGGVDVEFQSFTTANRTFADKAMFLSSGCNPLAGTSGCLKVALDPVDLDVERIVFSDQSDPVCVTGVGGAGKEEAGALLKCEELESAIPEVMATLMGGAVNLWLETQVTMAGLTFDVLFAGPDRYASDLDGNGKGDYLTCAGSLAQSFDLAMLMDLFVSGAGINPCTVENLQAKARRESLAAAGARPSEGGGVGTFILDPRTGRPESRIQLEASEARAAGLLAQGSRVEVQAVGSGTPAYTFRLDRGPFRVSYEPSLRLPFLLEGYHILEVQAVDATGATDPTPARLFFRIDSVGPKIRLHGLAKDGRDEGQIYLASEPFMDLEVSDYLTPFERIEASYRLDEGAPVAVTAASTRIDVSSLNPDSRHTLAVRAVDAGGIESVREIEFRTKPELNGSGSGKTWGCTQVPY